MTLTYTVTCRRYRVGLCVFELRNPTTRPGKQNKNRWNHGHRRDGEDGRVQVVEELILCYTFLGGFHVRFPNFGRVRTRATRAVAVPMIGTREIRSHVCM